MDKGQTMTDQEIIELAGEFIDGYCDHELIEFARAIEQRALTMQKAKWSDLLEALEELMTCKQGELCDHYPEAYKKARAAVAKARGE
jgi:hypothetical protein